MSSIGCYIHRRPRNPLGSMAGLDIRESSLDIYASAKKIQSAKVRFSSGKIYTGPAAPTR